MSGNLSRHPKLKSLNKNGSLSRHARLMNPKLAEDQIYLVNPQKAQKLGNTRYLCKLGYTGDEIGRLVYWSFSVGLRSSTKALFSDTCTRVPVLQCKMSYHAEAAMRATFLRWFSRKLGYEVAKSLGSRMPMPLGKQVFLAGVAASGSCAILYYLVQKTFSRASYYQLALEQLHSHPEALEALGTPLNVHYLQLTDKYNFVDIADAKLKIPVSGPKSEGHLYVSSSRDAPFKRWNLQEVFLELKDGQQIPLFKPSRDNDEVKKE